MYMNQWMMPREKKVTSGLGIDMLLESDTLFVGPCLHCNCTYVYHFKYKRNELDLYSC